MLLIHELSPRFVYCSNTYLIRKSVPWSPSSTKTDCIVRTSPLNLFKPTRTLESVDDAYCFSKQTCSDRIWTTNLQKRLPDEMFSVPLFCLEMTPRHFRRDVRRFKAHAPDERLNSDGFPFRFGFRFGFRLLAVSAFSWLSQASPGCLSLLLAHSEPKTGCWIWIRLSIRLWICLWVRLEKFAPQR